MGTATAGVDGTGGGGGGSYTSSALPAKTEDLESSIRYASLKNHP